MIRTSIQGSPTATASTFTYEIVEKLIRSYCTGGTPAPVVNVLWTLADSQLVGTILYATLQATITVTYKPKCGRNLITNTYSESFVTSFAGATASNVVNITSTSGYTDPAYLSNCNCCVAQGIKQTGTVTATMA